MNDNFKQVIQSLEESKKLAASKADSAQQNEMLVKSIGGLQTAIIESMKILANNLVSGTLNINDKSNKGTVRTPDAIVAAETVKSAIDLVSKNIANLDAIVIKKELDITPIIEGLKSLSAAIGKLPTAYPAFPTMPKDMAVNNLDLVVKAIAGLNKQLQSINFNPNIKVASPIVNVDLSADLKRLEKAIKEIKPTLTMPEMPAFDTSRLEAEVIKVADSINKLEFPVPNIKPTFVNTSGVSTAVTLTSTGRVPVELGISPTIDIGDVQVKDASGTVINPSTKEKQDSIISAITNLHETTDENRDLFGSAITGSRYNQVEIDYSSTDPDAVSIITVTKTGTGDAANANGQAVFSTGTGTTSGIKAVTNQSITYRPHTESYAAFSAIFTAGVANSYQRIGIYDTNNGFFIGYEGTSFGITVRKAATDTTIAQASFNVDTLTGGATSKYTRNGVPESIDPTKDNLYRIRYGWLGASGIYFEVLSPDQMWVTFHIHRTINTGTSPSVTSPNLPITLDARKTSGATNIVMNTACWAAGTTSNFQKITDTLTDNTLATLGRSVITGQTSGGGGGYVNVKVTPSGSLTTAIGDITGVVGQNTMANSLPVTIASNQTAVPVSGTITTTPTTYSTSSVTSVAASATSVQLLASTAGRRGAYFFNDSTADCYLKLGTTASTTSFTIKMAAGSFYELPQPCYTGRIDAIWSAANGSARITEIS